MIEIPTNQDNILQIPNVFSSSEWILKPREDLGNRLEDLLGDRLEDLSVCSSISEFSSIDSSELRDINKAFEKSWNKYQDKDTHLTPPGERSRDGETERGRCHEHTPEPCSSSVIPYGELDKIDFLGQICKKKTENDIPISSDYEPPQRVLL